MDCDNRGHDSVSIVSPSPGGGGALASTTLMTGACAISLGREAMKMHEQAEASGTETVC